MQKVSQPQSLEEQILQYFRMRNQWKSRELLKEMGTNITERTLRYELAKLREKGILNKKGKGPATYWFFVIQE